MSVVYEPQQNTLQPTGSIRKLMDEFVALEEAFAAEFPDLRVYRWQPNVAQLPAVWNWIAPSSFEIRDQTRWRDNLAVSAFVGIRHTDNETEMDALETYADAFRDVIDQALYTGRMIPGSPGPLNGTATWAERQSMVGPLTISMNEIPVIAFQFAFLFKLDRRISPTGQ